MSAPADLQAEEYVLAAAIESRGKSLGIGNLRPDDFYDVRHGRLFEALQGRVIADRPIEYAALLPVVASITGLDSAWLSTLMEIRAMTANVGYYAERVHLHATRRAIIAAGQQAIEIGTTAEDSADILEAANDATARISRAAQYGMTKPTHSATLVHDFLDSLEAPDEFTPTPWHDLNKLITGLMPGCLYVVGARPGCCKSTMGMCAAMHAAKLGHRAFFASIEMSEHELLRRMVSNVGKIDHDRLVRKALDDNDWARAASASATISEWPLHVADDVSTPAEVIGRAHTIAREDGPLSLIVVDYVQLMRGPETTKANRQEVVSQFSRSLKLAAKALHVPVIALSQLNRESEKRSDKKPVLSDLRESGALEQDADVVILQHRDPDGDHPELIQAAVHKNRHGRTGAFDWHFMGAYQRIESTTLNHRSTA